MTLYLCAFSQLMSATPTVTGQSCPSLKCQGQRKSFRWLLRFKFYLFLRELIDNVKHVLCMCIHSLKRVRATNFCFPRSWAFQLLKRFAALFGEHFVKEKLRNSACSTSQKTLSMYVRNFETVSMRPQPLNPICHCPQAPELGDASTFSVAACALGTRGRSLKLQL